MELLKKLTSKKKSKKSSKEQPPTPQQPVLHEPNPNAPAPKGILKNANDTKKYSNFNAYPTSDDIDESLRNAQKNSSLNQSIGTTQENTKSPSPQNEEQKLEPLPPKKSNDDIHDNLNKKQKDLKWDEANLEQNEKEKVPRMKIDEPPTPFAEMPEELRADYDEHEDVEEVILDDLNPMEMSLDEQHEPDLESADIVNEINSKKTLDQQQQALLLQDEEYRQKMVKDALNRREDENHIQHKQKIVKSAWEDDEDEQGTPDINKTDTKGQDEMSEDEKKKAAFKKKRKAHYNEFHAIKAWRAQKDDIE